MSWPYDKDGKYVGPPQSLGIPPTDLGASSTEFVQDKKVDNPHIKSAQKLPVRKPYVKKIQQVSSTEELTPDALDRMENNVFVRLREKYPNLRRRELRAEARRRVKEEIRRRK